MPIPYTTDPYIWAWCHFTSDPNNPDCDAPYPTKDYTWDANIWPECGDPGYTQNPFIWPWCDPVEYTCDPQTWPWCAPNWTWDPQQWPECQPGYTNDPGIWPECGGAAYNLYTQNPQIWPECDYYTADARIWPECHYTSDPANLDCDGTWWPTKDYTTDTVLWPECDVPPGYTADPNEWPECHYTSDPVTLARVRAPAKTSAIWATRPTAPTTAADHDRLSRRRAARDAGQLSHACSIRRPACRRGRSTGSRVSMPGLDRGSRWRTTPICCCDEDGVVNIDPSTDTPDRDGADDGLRYPV